MHAKPLQTRLCGLPDHGEEVVDVTVDVPVGKKADEVKGRPLQTAIDDLPPEGRLVNPARGDIPVDELRTLVEDPPIALCPTSELPMSCQLGNPTDGPWARSRVWGQVSVRRSRVGVRARYTALESSCLPIPTPSMMTISSGPGRPGNLAHFASLRSLISPTPSKADLGDEKRQIVKTMTSTAQSDRKAPATLQSFSLFLSIR